VAGSGTESDSITNIATIVLSSIITTFQDQSLTAIGTLVCSSTASVAIDELLAANGSIALIYNAEIAWINYTTTSGTLIPSITAVTNHNQTGLATGDLLISAIASGIAAEQELCAADLLISATATGTQTIPMIAIGDLLISSIATATLTQTISAQAVIPCFHASATIATIATIAETAHAADSVIAHHITTVQVIETFGTQGKVITVSSGETLNPVDHVSGENLAPVSVTPFTQLNGFGMAGGGTLVRRSTTRQQQPETIIRVRVTAPDDIEETKQYIYKIRRPVVSALIESSPSIQSVPCVTLNGINHVLYR
jgi:hypothetical protein